jgi:uncharacterized protein
MALEFPVNESNSQPPPLPDAPTPPPVAPLSIDEEHTWAMLAHFSVLLNLVTGFLGPVAALVIYLIYKDRSRYVAFHSLQSFIMQMVLWIGGGLIAVIFWIITGALTLVIVGICLIPIALVISLLPLAALVYGVIGGIETSQGHDFRYYLAAGWTDELLKSNRI